MQRLRPNCYRRRVLRQHVQHLVPAEQAEIQNRERTTQRGALDGPGLGAWANSQTYRALRLYPALPALRDSSLGRRVACCGGSFRRAFVTEAATCASVRHACA